MSFVFRLAALALAGSATLALAGPALTPLGPDRACPKVSVIADGPVVRPPAKGPAPCGLQPAQRVTVSGDPIRIVVSGVDDRGGARRERADFPVGLAGIRVQFDGRWIVEANPPAALVRVIETKAKSGVFVTEIRARFPPTRSTVDGKVPVWLHPGGGKPAVGAPQRTLTLTIRPMDAAPARTAATVAVSDFRGNRVVQPLELVAAR